MTRLLKPKSGLIGRRRVLQGMGAGATLLATPSIVRAQDDDMTLNMLTWPGHTDPAVIGPFEEATGIKVVAKEYVGGDNMVALVNQSPPGTYDVILSDAEFVIALRDGGFIEPMTPADYPFEDFFPEFQEFPGHWLDGELYSVIVRYGFLGLSYRTDVLSQEEVDTYQILLDEKVAGKVGYFDWYLPSMGCLSCGAGHVGHPYDITSDEFDALLAFMDQVKGQTSGFYSMADTFSSLTNGDAAVIPGVGDWITQLLAADGVPVASWVPREGGVQWTESLSIGAGSSKQEMAKQFIQYMTSPQGQALSAVMPAYNASIPSRAGWEYLNANMPEDAVRLRMTFEDNNVMDDYAQGKINIRKTPVQQPIEDWTDAWTDFKA
ncbi:MAG: extracellular solute-binding protein [Paracoccaceae bacterium]|nr:extracellular solute-binding protein [Paracoccaceae bacterium]